MNKRIALVMQWINDPKSVTNKELIDNANAALAEDAMVSQSVATQAACFAAYSLGTHNRVKYRRGCAKRAAELVERYLLTTRVM